MSKQMNILLTSSNYTQIANAARDLGVTKSDFVREAIKSWIIYQKLSKELTLPTETRLEQRKKRRLKH